LAALNKIDRDRDASRDGSKRRPVIRGQDNHRKLAFSEVLLMRNVLIARDQHIEALGLGLIK